MDARIVGEEGADGAPGEEWGAWEVPRSAPASLEARPLFGGARPTTRRAARPSHAPAGARDPPRAAAALAGRPPTGRPAPPRLCIFFRGHGNSATPVRALCARVRVPRRDPHPLALTRARGRRASRPRRCRRRRRRRSRRRPSPPPPPPRAPRAATPGRPAAGRACLWGWGRGWGGVSGESADKRHHARPPPAAPPPLLAVRSGRGATTYFPPARAASGAPAHAEKRCRTTAAAHTTLRLAVPAPACGM